MVEASWRSSTDKRYGAAWRQWIEWCGLQGVQATSPTLADILNYLASLYDKGAQYRTINLHRSALSSTLKPIDGFCVGQHPLVCRLLKGAFNSRPPRPKLCPTWSVQRVLNTLAEWSPASKLSLKLLTFKTCMLLALASAKRPSSLTLLSTKPGFCELSQDKVRFQPVDLEKTEGLSHCSPPLVLSAFTEDPRLCPVHYLRGYLRRTKDLRTSDRLFVALTAPHGAVSVSSVTRWLKKTISLSGQDGSGGSTRSASGSQAIMNGASLKAVLDAGDWARASTFKKFYYKPTGLSFQEIVLTT